MEINDQIPYVRISRRIKALSIDTIVLVMAFALVLFVAAKLNIHRSTTAAVFIILIVGSLEPVFVAFTGSSIGHHLVGLRVRHVNSDKRLNIFLSYIRFLTKLPLGLLSFISILTTRKHQAIHDLLSRSIVVHKNPNLVLAFEVIGERIPDTEHYIYPSRLKRFLMISLYLFVGLILFTTVFGTLISSPCRLHKSCSKLDDVLGLILSVIFWVGIFAIIGLGWQSRLFGCRRRFLTVKENENA